MDGRLESTFGRKLTPNPRRESAFKSQTLRIVIWIVTASVMLAAGVFTHFAGTPSAFHQLTAGLTWSALFIVAAELCGLVSFLRRFAPPLDGLAQIGPCYTAFVLLQYSAAGLALPLIDEHLAGIDRALGFNWPDYFAAVSQSPVIAKLLWAAYASYLPQILILPFAVGFWNPMRLQQCLLANLLTLTGCLIVFALLPAAGAADYYHVPGVTTYYGAQFAAARAGTIADLHSMTGIIQFPSYHAAMAVLFTYGFAGLTRWVAVPVGGLNVAMAFSALFIGGHHLVDVFAGLALALGAIWLIKRWTRSRQ